MRFETVFERRVTRSIEDWLGQRGLGRYAQAFVAAEVDVDIVAELTEADLVELGVVLGDRKRILRASAEKPVAPLVPRGHPSIIYCDLVESTDLAVRLEPQELRAVIVAYHARCADVVAAHGGEAQYLGGGVMVRFADGAGEAEDAARAARCAQALIVAIGEFTFPGPNRLRTRIGIATGSEADSSTPSLAARLQRFADPECVLVAAATHRLLRDTFSFTPLGSRAVTGFGERIEVWQLDARPHEPKNPALTEFAPKEGARREHGPNASSPRGSTSDAPVTSVAAPEAAGPIATGVATVAPATAPQTPAKPPFVERHFEDGGEPLAALQHWQAELERAERHHDPGGQLESLHALWIVAFSVGDLSFVLDTTARGITLYDAARHDARRIASGEHDAGVCAAGYRALAMILCGRIAEGRSWMRRAEAAIARIEHPPTRCIGALELAIARELLGEHDVAIARANEARKLAAKHGLTASYARAALTSAAARIGMGDRVAGTRALASALDEPGSALPAGWRPYYLVRLAFADIALGDDGAVAAHLATAETIARLRGGCVAAAEIERATAALLRLRGAPTASVAERLAGAARLARAQLASLLELRAASDTLELALALPDDGADAATRGVRSVLAGIEGGENTLDVRRARALEQRAVTSS